MAQDNIQVAKSKQFKTGFINYSGWKIVYLISVIAGGCGEWVGGLNSRSMS